MERIKRRKPLGLQDRYLYDYTFASNSGQNPLMNKARAYVENCCRIPLAAMGSANANNFCAPGHCVCYHFRQVACMLKNHFGLLQAAFAFVYF